MYPGLHAKSGPNQPAIIMAQSGEAVTYGELERHSNRLAHFLRASGLSRLTSPFTFQRLLGDSENIAPNLVSWGLDEHIFGKEDTLFTRLA